MLLTRIINVQKVRSLIYMIELIMAIQLLVSIVIGVYFYSQLKGKRTVKPVWTVNPRYSWNGLRACAAYR